MHFNRFDICNAYYVFASLYHGGQGSKEYRIFGRLSKIGYKPALDLCEDDLTENSKDIFNKLVSNFQDGTLPQDYEPCCLCGFDHAYEQAEAKLGHTASDF